MDDKFYATQRNALKWTLISLQQIELSSTPSCNLMFSLANCCGRSPMSRVSYENYFNCCSCCYGLHDIMQQLAISRSTLPHRVFKHNKFSIESHFTIAMNEWERLLSLPPSCKRKKKLQKIQTAIERIFLKENLAQHK